MMPCFFDHARGINSWAEAARRVTKARQLGTGVSGVAKRALQTKRAQKKDSDTSALAVGSRLKTVREQAGLSQRELAKRAGVTNATISLIEQDSHAPSLASLHRILNAIPISMAEFFALPASRQNALFYEKGDLAVVTRGSADLRVLGSERRDKKL